MDMTRLPTILAATAVFSLCSAGALAQNQGAVEPTTGTEAAAPDEVLQQQAANKAMADFAKQQVAENEARMAEHAKAQAAYEAELARVEAAREARDAAAAKSAAEHEAAVAQWRADMIACKDGDQTKCPATAQVEKKPGLLKRLLPF
jgi:hypothetical protein